MKTVTIENNIEFVTKKTIIGTVEAEILNISLAELVQKRNKETENTLNTYKSIGFVGEKIDTKKFRFSKDIQVPDNKKEANILLNSLKKEYGIGFNSNLFSVFYENN